jgi:hypothetical protein
MSLYVEIVQWQGLAVIFHVVRFSLQEPVVCGLVAGLRVHLTAAVRFRTVPNRKQNFTHPLFSVLSAIIKIAKSPSRHLEKKPQQQ